MTESLDPSNQNPNRTINRLGFHYYPDTLHYTERDLQIWLPLLKDLQVGWVVLQSETGRAIPEAFISALVNACIAPIVQFPVPITRAPKIAEIAPLFEAYSHWGVKYIQIFDRPNLRSSWPKGNWAQQDLVERFLDRWLPLANEIVKAGVAPVFPGLEPGGNFWDTAFLRASLQSMERRNENSVLDNLVLSAYAWTFNRPLTWGVGGPERWPESRAYFTPQGSEDQLGFCIFDWYQAIAHAVLERSIPLILLQAGLPSTPENLPVDSLSSPEHITTMRQILAAVMPIGMGKEFSEPDGKPSLYLPAEVISCNFWLLASDEKSPYGAHAWFSRRRPVLAHAREIAAKINPCEPEVDFTPPIMHEDFFVKVTHPIKHYLLLPAGDLSYLGRWFTRLLPYIQKHNPTIGFSLDEAALAVRVTVAENLAKEAAVSIKKLQDKGCLVERISEDGTSIAM